MGTRSIRGGARTQVDTGRKGRGVPAFTAEGDLLFVAVRPGADEAEEDKPPASLWRLPVAGGEAVEVLALAGGVDGVRAARGADVAVVTAALLPSAADVEDDKRLRTVRKDAKVSAVLHTRYPVRHWDHDIGPAQPHLLEVPAGANPAGPRPPTRAMGCATRLSTSAMTAASSSPRGRFPRPVRRSDRC